MGAGPAGALSAIYLAKQNYDVEVKSFLLACLQTMHFVDMHMSRLSQRSLACVTAELAFRHGVLMA